MSQKRYTYVLILFAIIVGFSMVSYLFKDFFDVFGIFGSRENLQSFLGQFGPLAPFVLISLITIEVILAPLPGGVFPIVGGVLFGPIFGTLYAWLGNILGSIVAFTLARKFGKKVITFFVSSFQEGRYDNEIKENKRALLFMYMVPMIPVDILSFALGVSTIPFRQFIVAISIAFFIRMAIWNFFGDAIGNILFV